MGFSLAAALAGLGGCEGGDDVLGDAQAPPGDADERPTGCGEVPAGFACEGDTLRHCEDGAPAALRCAAYTSDAGTCALVSPARGHYCVSPVGAPCRMAVPHGTHDHIYFASCLGAGSGCIIRVTQDHEYESACAPDLGACDARLVGRCLGDRLVLRCEHGMPVTYDCASFGGRCDASIGVCVGVVEGRRCGASFLCAAGLTCAPVAGRRGVSACGR